MAKNTMRKTALTTVGYTVDYDKETIFVTKEFGRLASIPQSKEFKKLTTMRREYGFKVSYRTMESKPHDRYEDLTIEQMEINIKNFLRNDQIELTKVLKEFHKTKATYAGKKGYYGKMKKWYLDRFKDEHKATFSKKPIDEIEDDDELDTAI